MQTTLPNGTRRWPIRRFPRPVQGSGLHGAPSAFWAILAAHQLCGEQVGVRSLPTEDLDFISFCEVCVLHHVAQGCRCRVRRLMCHVSCTWPLLPWAHQPLQTLLAATPVQHTETANSMNILLRGFMQRLSSPPRPWSKPAPCTRTSIRARPAVTSAQIKSEDKLFGRRLLKSRCFLLHVKEACEH